MKDFELPSNIKQIGAIGDGVKIYVEDYVNTYLRQLADASKQDRRAFLVGKKMVIDGAVYLFISGAVCAKFEEESDGSVLFSRRSFADAKDMVDAYFDGLEIVGWMQSQPGYGVGLNQACKTFHMTNFAEPHNVLFAIDPSERVSVFYGWDENVTELRDVKGYFIYYDKNQGMQEYMADNKVTKAKRAEVKTVPSPSDVSAAKPRKVYPEDRDHERDHAPRREYKRVVNLLVSLSAVLFALCFIIGFGLIQSDGRISKLEKNLTVLDYSYNYLQTSIKDATDSLQSAWAAFSEQNSAADGLGFAADGTATANSGANIGANTGTNISRESILDVVVEPQNVNSIITAGSSALPTSSPSSATAPAAAYTPAPTIKPADAPTVSSDAGDHAPVVFAADEYESYIVERGDSLIGISVKFYGSGDRVEEIMAVNNIDDPDKIFFGKVLLLPKR